MQLRDTKCRYDALWYFDYVLKSKQCLIKGCILKMLFNDITKDRYYAWLYPWLCLPIIKNQSKIFVQILFINFIWIYCCLWVLFSVTDMLPEICKYVHIVLPHFISNDMFLKIIQHLIARYNLIQYLSYIL